MSIAENRRAKYDYEITDTLEAGIILVGSEVKSLREGKASLSQSYAGEKDGKLVMFNSDIAVYSMARNNHEPKRVRELLVKGKERDKIFGLIAKNGLTVVPMSIYFNENGKVKVKLGLAKGKKKFDKRKTEKDRDWKRYESRVMKNNA